MKLAESVIKSLVKEMGESDFCIALRNSFAHGEICPNITQDELAEMFEHFEALIKIINGN